MKYSGICVARQDTIEYTTGDVGDPVVKNLHGISTTLPMPCEKYIWENEMSFDVFMPQAGNTWVSFSYDEFDRQFLVVQGWVQE